ncbi:trehalose-6-phosphate synthase [Hamadaea sp. NPDC050747]|uniref:alpha,alpha-trehalose-phosphate synthase (UDP-forming) n=1 Tax=Hamadaea sp. NPDC050747 TaxID=3155789 RepID=UPI0033EDF49B
MSQPETFDVVALANTMPAEQGPPGWRPRRRAGSVSAGLAAAVGERAGAWLALHELLPRAAGVAGLRLKALAAPQDDIDEYYLGQCVETLLPLYHDCGQPPQFHPRWQDAYRRVNHRYAVAAARLAAPNATVWIHDYHLQLVAGYLRRARPDLRIGFQLHIPFPPVERFLHMPMRDKMLRGLLGADLIGLPDARSTANFLDLSAELTGQRRGDRLLLADGRVVTAATFAPAADTTTISRLAATADVQRRARDLRNELGDPRTILLSVGALDHHEGIEQRLDAYAQLIAEDRIDPLDTVLVHVAAAGDETAHHTPVQDRVDRQVAQINGMYSRLGHPVVHYVRHDLDRASLAALYVAADVLLALPLRQGATLAAREFAACRPHDTGQILLSEFTGSTADLPEATLVNPHDVPAVKDAICAAIKVCDQPDDAMAAMRANVGHRDAAWATSRFLRTLSAATAYRDPAVPHQSVPGTAEKVRP